MSDPNEQMHSMMEGSWKARALRAEAERDRLGEVASELYEALSDLRALEEHHAAWDGGVGFSGVLFRVRRSVDVALESYRALDGEDNA